MNTVTLDYAIIVPRREGEHEPGLFSRLSTRGRGTIEKIFGATDSVEDVFKILDSVKADMEEEEFFEDD
jgi:hypothetical protein